jgi:hypothetical protein
MDLVSGVSNLRRKAFLFSQFFIVRAIVRGCPSGHHHDNIKLKPLGVQVMRLRCLRSRLSANPATVNPASLAPVAHSRQTVDGGFISWYRPPRSVRQSPRKPESQSRGRAAFRSDKKPDERWS